jgi:FkbM family methyltransferase
MWQVSLNLTGKLNYILYIIRNYPEWYLIFSNRLLKKPITKLKLKNGLIILGGKRSLILDIADEIFVQKVYNPKFMPIRLGSTVIDIGANVGIYSLYAAWKGAKKIYAFEPLSKNLVLINRNFKINRLPQPSLSNAAVTNKTGTAKLYLSDFDSHGLLFDHNYKDKFTKHVDAKTVTLSRIIQVNRIKKVDFLKIDCEGSEGEIIYSTPKSIWEKIDKIAIEYHNGVSSYSHTDILKKLKKVGYRTKVKVVDPFLGYIYAWK